MTDTPEYAPAAPAADTPEAAPEQAAAGTLSGDEVIAEANLRHANGDELDAIHVRALEHPEEFAGQQVPAPDTGIAPTS